MECQGNPERVAGELEGTSTMLRNSTINFNDAAREARLILAKEIIRRSSLLPASSNFDASFDRNFTFSEGCSKF